MSGKSNPQKNRPQRACKPYHSFVCLRSRIWTCAMMPNDNLANATRLHSLSRMIAAMGSSFKDRLRLSLSNLPQVRRLLTPTCFGRKPPCISLVSFWPSYDHMISRLFRSCCMSPACMTRVVLTCVCMCLQPLTVSPHRFYASGLISANGQLGLSLQRRGRGRERKKVACLRNHVRRSGLRTRRQKSAQSREWKL